MQFLIVLTYINMTDDATLQSVFHHILAAGTETFLGIIGLTVVLSGLCHQVNSTLVNAISFVSNYYSNIMY